MNAAMHGAPAGAASSGPEEGHWQRALHGALGTVDGAAPHGQSPQIIRTFRLGHLQVATIEGGAMRLWRDQPPATGDDGLLVVMVVVSGAAVVEQDNRRAFLNPGDMVLYDTSRPVSLELPGPFCVKMLVVPRRLAGLRNEHLQRIIATTVRPDSAMGAVAAGFLMHLADTAAHCPAPTAVPLASSVIDLLSLLAEELVNLGEPAPAHLDRLPAIKEFIEQHINDPGLTPQSVAHANAISVRYLHKLFQAEGDTPGQWIQRSRLHKCRGELAGLGAAKRSIAGVARQWGFTSASHFSRTFRSLYGITPAEWRDPGVKALGARCRRESPGRPSRARRSSD